MLLRLQNGLNSMSEMTRQQERVANNLANAGTVGYKRDRMFAEEISRYLDANDAPRSDRNVEQWADLQQGALEKTDNPLDVALEGDGFFVLNDEATGQARYSRAGRFVLDPDGMLRTPQGLGVEGIAGPITVPPGTTDIAIDHDGSIRADGQTVGQLQVVTFADPLALQRLDGATFAAGGQVPDALDTPVIKQGMIETSNIDPVREMTDMITHFRTFEAQQKLLRSTDELLGSITRDLGRF